MHDHRANTHFDGIQALRFVAAFLVLLDHSTHFVAERLVPDYPVWDNGAAGVDIFFVISGFVMVMSSRGLIGTPNAGSIFFIRRIARIVPIYWMATTFKLLVILIVPAIVVRAGLDLSHVFSSYLFLPARSPDGRIAPLLGVGWTLNFEMFFYSVFAIALAARISPYRLVGALFLGLAVLALFRNPDWPAVAFWADAIVLEFVAGMLLAKAYQAGVKLTTGPSIALLVVGFFWLFQYPSGDALSSSLSAPTWGRVLAWGIPAVAIVTAVVYLEPLLRGRIPGSLLLLGEASYALYLFHTLLSPVAPQVLARYGLPIPILSVTLSILIALISAVIIYRWVERPASLWLRNRLEVKYRRAVPQATGESAIKS
jgi:peptidoglycan/LPS O-acetylase OafA/YrhL